MYGIRCESIKITKIQAVNTNFGVLGLDLNFKSPEPVNFFGAQSSLGGHNFCLGGPSSHLEGHGPGMPPVAPGLVLDVSRVVQFFVVFFLFFFFYFHFCHAIRPSKIIYDNELKIYITTVIKLPVFYSFIFSFPFHHCHVISF